MNENPKKTNNPIKNNTDDPIGERAESAPGFSAPFASIEEALPEIEKIRRLRNVDPTTHSSLLGAMLESAADGIVALDLLGNIVTYNQRFASMWGFTDDVLSRWDSYEMMVFSAELVEDREALIQIIRKRQSDPGLESVDVLRLKDGRIFERHAFPQRINKECVGVVVNYRDVTKRRDLEAALRLSEEKYRLLWDTAGEALLLVGSDNIIVESNAAVTQIFGYQPDEVVGRDISLLQPVQFREKHRLGLQRYLESGAKTIDWCSTEAFGLHRDGHEFPIEIAFNHIRIDGKDLFAGFIHDVTARKKAEEALGVLAAIVESSHDAIVSNTLDGIITSWNSGADRVFGYSSAEALGKSISLLIPPDRTDEEAGILARQARGEGVYQFETVRIRKDGTEIAVSVTLSPIKDRHERIVGISKIARDITERKQIDLEREKLFAREQEMREELQLANRTKDEFLATLSHELRTPLTTILGWSNMIADDRLSAKEKAKGIAIIRRSAGLQKQLVEEILDASQMITGKFKLDVRQVDLEVVLKAALRAERPAAKAKNILVKYTPTSIPSIVLGDASRLQQVLRHLLANAVKFTPEGGLVQVCLDLLDYQVQLSVEDNGIGIESDLLPIIFDRFRQADQSSTRNYGGLGLGLAIVRHIVEMHGGSVEAASAAGQKSICNKRIRSCSRPTPN